MFLAFPCNKTIRWTHGKKGILSHFWNLQSLDPTKQYVKKNWWKLTRRFFFGESWHVELFLKFSPLRPYKANGWTSAENWHVGLFLQFITSRRLHKIQSSTCNIWTKLTCWVVVLKFEWCSLHLLFLPLEKITLNIWTKWNVIILIFVISFSYGKPICWTCEEHWHREPFLKLTSLDPTKQ